MPPALNPLAEDLNSRLEAAAPEVLAMLSAYGRRIYFPKGILSQGAEAKKHAHKVNATVGIATEGGHAMHLPSMARHVGDLAPEEIYNYAPPAGRPGLRERWREKLLEENPSLRGKQFGLQGFVRELHWRRRVPDQSGFKWVFGEQLIRFPKHRAVNRMLANFLHARNGDGRRLVAPRVSHER